MHAVASFVHLAFAGFFALFPVINPLGTALLVDPLLARPDMHSRLRAARRVAVYCCGVGLVTTLAGSWIFKAFGVSLPVVQVAGGLLICHMGWQLLMASPGGHSSLSTPVTPQAAGDPVGNLFYPVAFPMTTGPGTITVLLTLSARANEGNVWRYAANLAALDVAVVLMCVLIYLCYGYTPRVLRWLGGTGHQIVSRLSAFLVLCVGLQIVAEGVTTLVEPLLR